PVTCSAPVMLPPPSTTVKVTGNPATGAPFPSFSVTLGRGDAAVPLIPNPGERPAEMVPSWVPVARNSMGLPVRPGDVAVTALAPTLPRTHEPTVAIPFSSLSASAPVRVPLPSVTWKVTGTPATGVPWKPVIQTAGGVGTGPFTGAVWFFSELRPIVVGMRRSPLAVNVIGLPARPAALAVTVLAPVAGPRVQEPTVAMPSAPLSTDAPATVPPPDATAKVTDTPATTLPPASVTLTAGGNGTGSPTSPG